MSDKWLWMSAGDLGREIEAGRVDPRTLTQMYLDAIGDHPDSAEIYARPTSERAHAEAEAAHRRARAGLRIGPLDGVPVSWKDLFDSAGVATEAGTALLEGRVPERDALALARASRAGLVCLGKTHLSELAFSGLGVNPVTATPPNINDPECAPGGSSSGAALSVASGLAAAAIGSDTGGSVRLPAAWNDLVGFKTTWGAIPLTGTVPLCPSFDTIGPLTRSVEDAALLFAALTATRVPDLAGAALSGARLIVADFEEIGAPDAAPGAAFDAALRRFEAAGARLIRRALPPLAEVSELAGVLYAGEACGIWRETIRARPDAMFARIRERFEAGEKYSAPDLAAARARAEELTAAYIAATRDADAVVLPTAPIMPPQVGRLLDDPGYYAEQNFSSLRYTRLGNMLGVTALSLPAEAPGCGVMAMAPPGQDRRLLRLGRAMEAALAG